MRSKCVSVFPQLQCWLYLCKWRSSCFVPVADVGAALSVLSRAGRSVPALHVYDNSALPLSFKRSYWKSANCLLMDFQNSVLLRKLDSLVVAMLCILLLSFFVSKCMVQFVAFVELLPVSSIFIINNTSKFWMHSLFLKKTPHTCMIRISYMYICVCVWLAYFVSVCVCTHMHRKASILIMLKFISPIWCLQCLSWP